jgi:hypothetical protein
MVGRGRAEIEGFLPGGALVLVELSLLGCEFRSAGRQAVQDGRGRGQHPGRQAVFGVPGQLCCGAGLADRPVFPLAVRPRLLGGEARGGSGDAPGGADGVPDLVPGEASGRGRQRRVPGPSGGCSLLGGAQAAENFIWVGGEVLLLINVLAGSGGGIVQEVLAR